MPDYDGPPFIPSRTLYTITDPSLLEPLHIAPSGDIVAVDGLRYVAAPVGRGPVDDELVFTPAMIAVLLDITRAVLTIDIIHAETNELPGSRQWIFPVKTAASSCAKPLFTE